MASCRLLGLATLFLLCVPTNGKGTCKAGDSTCEDETDMLSTTMYQKKIGAHKALADPVAADPADPPADPAATPPAADAAPAAVPVVPSAASVVKGRVWMVCKGAVQAAPTDEIAGLETAREMNCTAQMPFRELCCAPWGSMTFPDPFTSPVFNAPKAEVSLPAISAPKEILKICTMQTSLTEMMKAAGVTVATVTGECINKEFTMDMLQGKGDGATADEQNLKPGEIVLRERIRWFLEQGIPAENVPTCAKEVSKCAGGQTVLAVEESWIKQTAESLAAAKTKQSLIQGQSLAPASDEGAIGVGWGGSLMTSGSFTMSASSGD